MARQLELMLVTVEPKREKKSKWQTQDGIQIEKPGWFPYVPEFQVVVLSFRKTGQVSTEKDRRL